MTGTKNEINVFYLYGKKEWKIAKYLPLIDKPP